MATRENAEYVCLEGLKHGNRFYSNNEPEIDPTLSAEGELWYRVLGYADSSDEALSIIASAPRVPTQRDEINHRAYVDVLEMREPTSNDPEYLKCYHFWYPLGPQACLERYDMED